MKSPVIWLCDLTYTQQSISNDTIPSAIGGIGANVLHDHPDTCIKIFKYPEDLSHQLDLATESGCIPDIISFSNYVWNANLSYAYCSVIKERFPSTLTVSGGPNFPFDLAEQQDFLSSKPFLDLYIQKEGEVAWSELVEVWRSSTDLEDFLSKRGSIANSSYLDEQGNLVTSPKIERIKNLSEMPSPYLMGLLDDYFDGRLLPVLQTNRGCPFTCTFCTEGQRVWSLVKRKGHLLVEQELDYIAKKLSELPPEKRRHDLLIADSNFGMYKEDIEVCEKIASIQDQYGWPTYINVATGKNNKERVLEAATLVKGAINLAGSVQTLNTKVQENIKRSNISRDQILGLAQSSKLLGADSYSELILALPGETKKTHIDAINTLVDAGFVYVVMYQLMLLPGTEMSGLVTRKNNKLSTKWRAIPRAFGTYEILGQKVSVGEVEEIVIATKDLSFRDYLDCRLYALVVNIFYNNGVFQELLDLLDIYDLKTSTWLNYIYEGFKDGLQSGAIDGLINLVNQFLEDTSRELWTTKSELLDYLSTPAGVQRFINGELGSNLIYKYKALSITFALEDLCTCAISSLERVMSEKGIINNANRLLIRMLVRHNYLRMQCLFDLSEGGGTFNEMYDFDLIGVLEVLANTGEKAGHRNVAQLEGVVAAKCSVVLNYSHSKEQISMIKSYIENFGSTPDGIARILTRVFLKQLFRIFSLKATSTDYVLESRRIDRRLLEA